MAGGEINKKKGASSSRSTMPPARPPAPKLPLHRLNARQLSTGSIAVHFSTAAAAAADEVDDEPHPDDTASPVDASPTDIRLSGFCNGHSQSAASSQATTPVAPSVAAERTERKAEVEKFALQEDEKSTSILSGIREKLNDPLNAFIGKLEEISSDTVFADIVERKLKKIESLDRGHVDGSTPKAEVAAAAPPASQSGRGATELTELATEATADEKFETFDIIECAEEAQHVDDGVDPSSPESTATVPPMSLSSLLSSEPTADVTDAPPVPPASPQHRPSVGRDEPPLKAPAAPGGSVGGARRRSAWWWSVPRYAALVVAVAAYLLAPLPPYLCGMLLGMLLAAGAMKAYFWLVSPTLGYHYSLPPLASLPPLRVPETREASGADDGIFKGWLNELNTTYDVKTYHLTQTQSVFVQLDGSQLRLQIPRYTVSRRDARDDTAGALCFRKQYFYSLVDSKVYLLPEKLLRKRTWSKKYPICVELSASAAAVAPPPPTTTDAGDKHHLYLFAHTDREKEEWYRRLAGACQGAPLPTRIAQLVGRAESRSDPHAPFPRCASLNAIDSPPPTPLPGPSTGAAAAAARHQRHGSTDSDRSDADRSDVSLGSPVRAPADPSPGGSGPDDLLLWYVRYMSKVMPAAAGAGGRGWDGPPCDPSVVWVNALVSRLFWDFLRERHWAERIQRKIQRKLTKIHVPYFIDELSVTGIELGREMPVIRRASPPYLDLRGLWIDLDIAYNGGFSMSLETKVNLMKLVAESAVGGGVAAAPSGASLRNDSERAAATDSDEEDSAESSMEEDELTEERQTETEDEKGVLPGGTTAAAAGGTASRKLLRIVNRITQSRYFQHATENKYIKKAMQGVSNTRLVLNVELRSLAGTLTLNIPPPPSDRLWYGFRKNPHLWLSAKPKVGGREVNVSRVTDWIEKKLATEFQRVFVMPNMDDVPIPLMSDNLASSAAT